MALQPDFEAGGCGAGGGGGAREATRSRRFVIRSWLAKVQPKLIQLIAGPVLLFWIAGPPRRKHGAIRFMQRLDYG